MRMPLAAARFPLVVDPLLSNSLLDLASDIDDVDIYNDDQEQNLPNWVVYSRYASANDRDLIGAALPGRPWRLVGDGIQ